MRRGSLFEERLPLSRSTGILAHSCSLSLHHQPGSAPLSPQLTPRNQAPEEVCGLSGLFLLPWRNTALYHPPRPPLSPCVMFVCPSQGPVGARAKCSERGALAGCSWGAEDGEGRFPPGPHEILHVRSPAPAVSTPWVPMHASNPGTRPLGLQGLPWWSSVYDFALSMHQTPHSQCRELSLIPGQGIRSHMQQIWVCMPKLKDPTCCNEDGGSHVPQLWPGTIK